MRCPAHSVLGLSPFSLLAIVDVQQEFDARARNAFRLDPTDALLILGVLVVVASLLFFWAFYVRKRPSEKNGVPILGANAEADQEGRRRVRTRRKRKRHHPDNFPRNPTLGETGGLPPLRPEEESVPPEGGAEPPKANS